jgi:hypothetical protein
MAKYTYTISVLRRWGSDCNVGGNRTKSENYQTQEPCSRDVGWGFTNPSGSVEENGSLAGSGEHHKNRTFESQLLMEFVQHSKSDELHVPLYRTARDTENLVYDMELSRIEIV